MYRWRKLNDEERRLALHWRQRMQRPLHSPRHIDGGHREYLITGACFEHHPYIGHAINRMNDFTNAWLAVLSEHCHRILAWVVLPNHYHTVVESDDVLGLLRHLGKLHGRTSFDWNGEEAARGRQVWCNAVETAMKSAEHCRATINYVHHNPVKHGYVKKWTDWPWSSAADYLAAIGRDEAERQWRQFPIERFGDGWDDPEM